MTAIAGRTKSCGPVPIAFVIDQLGVGGTERQLATLLQKMDRNLFEPVLVTLHEYEICFDVPCEKYLVRTRKVLSPRAFANVIRIASLFKRKGIQIVQAFFFDSAVLGVLAARLARVPRIVLSRRDMGFWQNRPRLAVMKAINRLSHRVLVNSESVRRQIMQNEGVPSEKIDLIYNGIDFAPFNGSLSPDEAKKRLGIPASSPVVGIVSNMNRDVKRVDLFLEAAVLVKKDFPKASFIIAGEGHLRGPLEEKSKALGLTGATRFLGSVKSVPALLRAFDIGVNSSDSEGLSNAVIEYLFAGLPAVVSSVPGNSEVVENGTDGLHFRPGDAASLATQISNLLKDPERARNMGGAGKKRAVHRFSAESMVQRHMDYYQQLLSARV